MKTIIIIVLCIIITFSLLFVVGTYIYNRYDIIAYKQKISNFTDVEIISELFNFDFESDVNIKLETSFNFRNSKWAYKS